MVTFLSPSSRGSAPARSCRARWPARMTNSNWLSLGVRCMLSSTRGCVDDLFGGPAHGLHPGPFGKDDGPDARDRRLELVVDDHVLVFGVFTHLAARRLQPLADLLLAVLAAA